MGYQQALLVSRKRESQVGQALIVPDGFSLPFPWNIIFAIYIVKNGYYCKFCSRNIFYSGTDVVGALHYFIYLVYFACELRPSVWVSATLRILISFHLISVNKS